MISKIKHRIWFTNDFIKKTDDTIIIEFIHEYASYVAARAIGVTVSYGDFNGIAGGHGLCHELSDWMKTKYLQKYRGTLSSSKSEEKYFKVRERWSTILRLIAGDDTSPFSTADFRARIGCSHEVFCELMDSKRDLSGWRNPLRVNFIHAMMQVNPLGKNAVTFAETKFRYRDLNNELCSSLKEKFAAKTLIENPPVVVKLPDVREVPGRTFMRQDGKIAQIINNQDGDILGIRIAGCRDVVKYTPGFKSYMISQ